MYHGTVVAPLPQLIHRILCALSALHPLLQVYPIIHLLFVVRTKQLTWSARVVSVEQYHTAKAQALDVQRERKRFEQQRYFKHFAFV